jgi:hypothetical protein
MSSLVSILPPGAEQSGRTTPSLPELEMSKANDDDDSDTQHQRESVYGMTSHLETESVHAS